MKKCYIGIDFIGNKEYTNNVFKVFDSQLFFKRNKDNKYSIYVNADDYEQAYKSVDYFLCCYCLVRNDDEIDVDKINENIFIFYNNIDTTKDFSYKKSQYIFNNNGFFIAADIATKSFNNISEYISIYKFYVCKRNFNLYFSTYDHYHLDIKLNTIDKTQILMNIVFLYSILEELKIVIENKFFLNSNYKKICGRKLNEFDRFKLHISKYAINLHNKGIDPEKRIPWLTIDNMPRPFTKYINTSDINSINDNETYVLITIKEAVYELDYQRNKIAAHSNSKDNKIDKLEAIDIENAYFLVREILLDYFKNKISIKI